MKKPLHRTPPPGFSLALLLFLGLIAVSNAHALQKLPRPAPEFTHQESGDWLNSPPLSVQDLRGRVLLLDFWTFDCWNCIRSFPWLHALETHFKDEKFSVIGVHTPEFAHERKRNRLEDKIKQFGLDHPVMMDNDFSYWNAMGTRYWPTFYLIDKKGLIRAVYLGETHQGDHKAGKIERMIEKLLAE